MSELWDIKYKPKKVDDLVLLPNHKKMLNKMIKAQDIGNSKLFYGTPGHGKTLMGELLIRNIKCDYKIVNGSDDNSVEYIRKVIIPFMKTMKTTPNRKIIMLDECLEENENVLLSNGDNVRIGDMVMGKKYNLKSLNLETGFIEDDIGEVISDKEDNIYQVELQDGRKIKLTNDHPFIVKDTNGNLVEKTIIDGLKVGDEIVTI